MASFRDNLREELDYQSISVKELASKTGISMRTIENYLSKRGSIPPADYACKIADVLDVSVEWLVTGITASVATDDDNDDDEQDSKENTQMLRDFNQLSPEVQKALRLMIHATAIASND